MNKLPDWLLWSFILLVTAIPIKFVLKGYDYIAYTLVFLAAVIVLFHFLPEGASRALLVLLCLGFIYFCVVEVSITGNAATDKDAERSYLVVLGAGVEGKRPSRSLRYRINAAYDYLLQYPESKAVLSGGQGDNEDITEAQCMFEALTEMGIPAERLILEPEATGTKENLEFSFRIIRSLGDDPDGNTAILSSTYHLYRAKAIAEKLGVHAAGVAAYPGWPLLAWNYYIREAFGVTHLWLLGR